MSDPRHSGLQVRSYAITHPPGTVGLTTRPGWDRLVLAAAGVFTAITDAGAWTVPADRLLCVPDGVTVELHTPGRVAIRCLYLVPELDLVGDGVRVIGLSPLARELLLYAVESAPMDLTDPTDVATITLLGHLIAGEESPPLHLPLPIDATARRVAESIRAELATPLRQHLDGAAANRRTLERRFVAETGMSLGRWRRRARILAGVAMLADGADVTVTAVTVGYATPSAFVEAFRTELGAPPRAFMRRERFTSGAGRWPSGR
jgi:AraC-like DNA-binding protein